MGVSTDVKSASVPWVGDSGIGSYETCLFMLWRRVARRMLGAELVDR